MRRLLVVLALASISSGGLLLSEQAWLTGKAMLAEKLIERAFAAHLRDGDAHRPWKWADMHPVARLQVPRLGVRRVVLTGASGSSLAFGPGHVDGTAAPNGEGNCVLAGHRDSWFAFLERIVVGDRLVLRSRSGNRTYRVRDVMVTNMWDSEILSPTEERRLTLVTCYPFRGLGRSRLRYVVVCLPVDDGDRRIGDRHSSRSMRFRPSRRGDVLNCRIRTAAFSNPARCATWRNRCPTIRPRKNWSDS